MVFDYATYVIHEKRRILQRICSARRSEFAGSAGNPDFALLSAAGTHGCVPELQPAWTAGFAVSASGDDYKSKIRRIPLIRGHRTAGRADSILIPYIIFARNTCVSEKKTTRKTHTSPKQENAL